MRGRGGESELKRFKCGECVGMVTVGVLCFGR
jgi:hypothetical protein